MIRVILVDDHALTRRGVRDTLSEHADIRVVGEAGHYAELRELLRRVECDVMLLDINLPGRNGIEVLQQLRDEQSPIKVLVLSMYPEDQYAIRALKVGASGYLNKASDPSLLPDAVRLVFSGRKYITPDIALALVDNLTAPSDALPHTRLSDRELQTLLQIAAGRRLSDIAEALALSPKTVSVYRARVLEKLGLSNNAELTHYALKHGLLE